MFPGTYFPTTYFPATYFPDPVVQTAVSATGSPAWINPWRRKRWEKRHPAEIEDQRLLLRQHAEDEELIAAFSVLF